MVFDKKEWHINNKDKKREYDIEYRFNNKYKVKEYRQSEKGKKSNRISRWKQKGLISDNYDEIYDRYISSNNCELCNKEYKNTRDRHMDHDHQIGKFRNIVCLSCNNSSKLKEISKNNTSGHKNIRITKYGHKVEITIKKKRYVKTLKTLEEAIIYRDSILV
tara:strand:+ start:472 stop:957 length:486 start_codon:yes stop_codon:yes gene_type:complete